MSSKTNRSSNKRTKSKHNRKNKNNNKKIVRVVKKMKKMKVKVLRGNEQQIEGELILKKENIYILKNEKLKIKIIQFYYGVLITEYKERQEKIKLVVRNYQWPKVIKNIKKLVNRCNLYQRIKNKT